MGKYLNIKITETQAGIILGALANESNDDAVEFGEYSYWRCYLDIKKKIENAKVEGVKNEKV